MPKMVRVRMLPDAQIAATIFRRGGDVDGAIKSRAERVARTARDIVSSFSATGALQRGIKVEQPRTSGGQFSHGYDVVSTAPYSLFVHEGRAAGSKMPPHDPIAKWAAFRGIPATAVFPIRRAIGQRGIKARPFLTDALRREGI